MKLKLVSVAMAGAMALAAGCQTANKAAPSIGPIVNFDLERKDFKVQETVTASSTEQSYFFGVYKVIDHDPGKYIIFGIRSFEDQGAIAGSGIPSVMGVMSTFFGATPTQRAVYKALSKAPDADMFIPKSVEERMSGVPFLASETTATVTGKSVKLYEDADKK